MSNTGQLITNCLWFDKQAADAARFYTSLFGNSSIGDTTYYGKEGFEFHQQPEGSVMTVEYTLSGIEFMGLNGGPIFRINPSISYFAICETEEETDNLWNALADQGSVLMPLQKYDWSEKYGWLQDRFGLSWQISLGKIADTGQKITPSFLFTGKQFGRAEEAVHFYTSVFDNSSVMGILKNGPGEDDPEGTVKHAQFKLNDQTYMIMESSLHHQFSFNEGVSLVVHCQTQEEIDKYWKRLIDGGGQESQCGWLKDKFGVSWQVVPDQLDKMLKSPDKKKTERLTKAYMQMKKFDLKKLQEVFEG